MIEPPARRPFWFYGLLAAAMMAAAAGIQRLMGRLWVSKSGTVALWSGGVGPENSQQIADWYSLSHVIHGMAFYALLRWLGRGRWSLGLRFALAVLIETGWEVVENTPWVIERYRHATAALGYSGDTVLNSACDTLCCIAGFFLAAGLPVWTTLGLAAAMEVLSAIVIRDNLALNILMLLCPIDAIKHWQNGR